jgi:hypothetical protein
MLPDSLHTIVRWWEIGVVLGLVLVGVLLGLALARFRVRLRIGRNRRAGRAGERRALELLSRAGFRILDTEVTVHGVVTVDGEPVEYHVRADAVVRRFFRRYVAEFKGGPEAARIGNRATRRQLLEYAVLFDCVGVLLVDADAGEIHRVAFPGVV